MEYSTKGKVLKKPVVWKNLFIYRKSDAIYQLTVEFCKRFLPAHGDRTVDQMVQAARSGKQNIVEGSEDGQTSSEMEIKLLNVARGSLQELRSDNDFNDYAPLIAKMNDEEMANMLLTLCHQMDKMMTSYIEQLEKRFVREGGIKERMHSARTGYRQEQDAIMKKLQEENSRLIAENAELKRKLEELTAT